MEFTWDGPSLPMLTIDHDLYRVQKLDRGQWRSLETEDEYKTFFELADVLE
jgi:hypothetical protein